MWHAPPPACPRLPPPAVPAAHPGVWDLLCPADAWLDARRARLGQRHAAGTGISGQTSSPRLAAPPSPAAASHQACSARAVRRSTSQGARGRLAIGDAAPRSRRSRLQLPPSPPGTLRLRLGPSASGDCALLRAIGMPAASGRCTHPRLVLPEPALGPLPARAAGLCRLSRPGAAAGGHQRHLLVNLGAADYCPPRVHLAARLPGGAWRWRLLAREARGARHLP